MIEICEVCVNLGHLCESCLRGHEWVNAKKQLPKYEGNYLIYDMRFQTIKIGQYLMDNEGILDFTSYASHWMPLPEVPNEI